MSPSTRAPSGRQSPPSEFAGEFNGSTDLDGAVDLRQGDVLELLSRESSTEFERHFGVVVTADCDIVQNKHYGVITFVPLVPLECYIHRFTLPKLLATEESTAFKVLKNRVLEKGREVLFERTIDMIESGGYTIDEICDTLGSVIDVRKEVVQYTAVRKAIEVVQESMEPATAITGLLEMAAAIDGTARTKKSKIDLLFLEIKHRLTRSIAGDFLFLNRIAPNRDTGYVAILRMLREVPLEQVALSASAEKQKPDQFTARRISRLDTLYAHRLVQQMGQVFTDIGLPGEYESSRDTVVATRLQGLLGLTTSN